MGLFKRKSLVGTFIVFSLVNISSSAFEEIRLENMSLTQEGDYHYLTGQQVLYSDGTLSFRLENPNTAITLNQGLLKASQDEINLSLNLGADSFFAGINSVNTEDFNFSYAAGQRLEFKNNGLTIDHSGGANFIPKVSLTCFRNNIEKGIVEETAALCMEYAQLKAPRINFDQLSAQKIAKALTSFEKAGNSVLSIDELEDVNLTVINKNFNLDFKAKVLFKLKIKANGSVDFDEENREVRIYLSQAKVGFLSVKRTVLNEIAKAGLSSVKVSGSTITIKF